MIRTLLPFGSSLALLAAAATAADIVTPVDLAKPERPLPGAGEATVVVRFHSSRMAGDNRVWWFRWDRAAGAPLKVAGKPQGFRANFSLSLFGGAKGTRELRVLHVPAGDYVLGGRTFNGQKTDSFCFGAPVFAVAPGDVIYLGEYEVFGPTVMPDRDIRAALRYGADLEGARAALAAAYPTLAPALKPWSPVNGNSFPCDGTEFTAYAVPGAPAAKQD